MAEKPSIAIEKGLVVELAPNGMQAALKLLPGMDPELITEELCIDHLGTAGIAEQCIPTDQVSRCVSEYVADPTTPRVLQLAGKPPVHGENGRLEWFPDMDPTHPGGEDNADRIDYYNRTSYVTVAKDQAFARIIQPTLGTPGMELRGNEIAPNPGKAASVTLAPSVTCDESGECRANMAGVLAMEGQTIRIEPMLVIPGSVDFSTGNIRFDGDVQVGGGVCDRFIVRASGDVEIKQMIGAAALDVGGDLFAVGGMAAKEQGHLRVGGHLLARYLDNVIGTIVGNLEVEREIIGCELFVSGIVQSPKAALLGGMMRCCDAVYLSRIGSMAAVPTTLDVGHVPTIEQQLAQLQQQRREAVEAMSQLQAFVQALGDSVSNELLDRGAKLQNLQTQFQMKQEMLESQLEAAREIDVNISLFIGPGVNITCGRQVFNFLDQLRGPIRITIDAGTLNIAIGGAAARPLCELPRIRVLTRKPPKSPPAKSPGGVAMAQSA